MVGSSERHTLIWQVTEMPELVVPVAVRSVWGLTMRPTAEAANSVSGATT